MSGKVKLGVDVRTGEAVAIKIMYKDGMSIRAAQQLRKEITAMKALNHPNVIRLKNVHENFTYVKKNGLEKDVVILVLELAAGGELFDFMMYTGAFPEVIARTYFEQARKRYILLSALETCHNMGIAHRDIKPENVLLDNRYQLRVADFGLSSIMEDENGVCYTECGTRSYMAPEVLAKQPYDGAKADLWSAGVVLFIMIAGNPPFQTATSSDWWFKAVSAGRYDRFWAAHLRGCPHFPELAQAFLNRIFVADPSQRATLQELKSHPWLLGETWSPDQLFGELHQRKRRVDEQKEAEKQAHLQRRMAEAAQAGRGFVDPFTLTVNRSIVEGSGGAEGTLHIKAPPLPPAFNAMHVLYSAEPVGSLLTKIASAFKLVTVGGGTSAPLVTSKRETAKVKAIFAGCGLEMVAQVYTGKDPRCFVVDVMRRTGDAFKFNHAREQLSLQLGEVVSGLADVKAVASRDAFDEGPETSSVSLQACTLDFEKSREEDEKVAECLDDVDVI
ncbi:unnamed protein product [Choristocarpus tenellus]